jgi:uncharacterized membrane protein
MLLILIYYFLIIFINFLDACQLVKANSIQGNKMNNLDIVYTMWDNLKKTASMEVSALKIVFNVNNIIKQF